MPTIKKLEFATGTDVTAPSDLSLESSTNSLSVYVDDAAFVAANGTAGEGDVYLNTTLKAPRAYISGAWRTGVMANDAADPTKTVGFDLTGSTTGTAQTLDFDNTVSRTYTFPNYAGRVVIQTGTETDPVLFPAATGNIDIGSATSTTRIVGNLEVQGTTTTLNTQTIQVEDNNIVLNFGGNDTTAQGSGLEVDRAGTHGSLVYDSAAATKWKAGNLGSEVEIVDKSTAQALTNKTIDASLNTLSNIGSAMLTGAVAPSKGGTGVANNDAATLTRSGNHALTVTTTATTNVTLPTAGTVATLAGAEVLTNKDIDGGTASNTSRVTVPKAAKTTLDALTRKEGTILYGTDTKKHYTDDGITLNEMGGGAGGAAGRNYLQAWYTGLNPISSVTGLTTTGNRTSSQTLWGSSAVADFEALNNVTSPLREGGDIKLDSKTTTINAFIETPMFSLDLVDLSKAIVLSFDVTGNSADGNYDVVVMRYNSGGTYQETISVAGNASTGTPASAKLPTGTTTFKGFFVSGSTATDLYAVRFRKLLAVNNDVQIDSLFVGPQSLSAGVAMQESLPYTPTFSAGWGTPTSISAKYRRVGEYLEVTGSFVSGTVAASLGSISIPSGLTIDTTKINLQNTTASAGDPVGWISSQSGASPRSYQLVLAPGTSTNFVYMAGLVTLNNALLPAASVAAIFDSSATTAFYFRLPVAQWSSNVTMADRQVEEFSFNTSSSVNTSDTTSFGYGPQGAQIQNITSALTRRVRFTSPILPTDSISIEVKASGSSTWVPITTSLTNSSASFFLQPWELQGGAIEYGVGRIVYVNSTDIDIRFGTYSFAVGVTYASAGDAWGSGSPSAGQAFWRVRKVSGGASVGYPVSARNLVGDTSGTAVPAGMIGQELYSFIDIVGAINLGSNNLYYDVTSRALTAGTWLVSANVIYIRNSATVTGADYECGVWGSSGNSSTGRVLGLNTVSNNLGLTTYTYQNITLPHLIVRCDGTSLYYPDGTSNSGTTLYLKAFSSTASAGNIKASGRLTAIRIA
jgi:hypothetical protein